jgi:hypothetical protein
MPGIPIPLSDELRGPFPWVPPEKDDRGFFIPLTCCRRKPHLVPHDG